MRFGIHHEGGIYERADLSHWSHCRNNVHSVASRSALSGGTTIMSMNESVAVPLNGERVHYIQWGPAVAGALAAAAISFVLHSFAVAMGLAVSSVAPTWRDSSALLQLLSGLYLVLVAIAAFGVGGYMAGRLRAPLAGSAAEVEFRDGVHGVLVWAIAMVLTAMMALATAQSLRRLAAPSGAPSGSAQSLAGENLVAYDLDRLFRSERRPQNTDLAYARSEAGRILLTSSGHSGVSQDDRAYLARLTASVTGLAAADAEKRVDTVIAQARDNIRKARRSAVILSFMTGAAALLGAAVAWFAACAGGEHRDGKSAASTSWHLWSPRLAR